MWYLILAVVCILAGGYGGYEYGRYVEEKAQAALADLKQVANDVKKAL